MWRFCLGITSINVIAIDVALLWRGASIIAAVCALPSSFYLIEYDMMLLPIGAHHSRIITCTHYYTTQGNIAPPPPGAQCVDKGCAPTCAKEFDKISTVERLLE